MTTRTSARTAVNTAKKAKENEDNLLWCFGCCGPFPIDKETGEPYEKQKAFETEWGGNLRLCCKCKHWVHEECLSANISTGCRTCFVSDGYPKGRYVAVVRGVNPDKELHLRDKDRCSMCLQRCGNGYFDCDKGYNCIQYKETRNAMAKVCTNCAGNKGKTCFRCSCSFSKPGASVPSQPVPAVEATSEPAGALVHFPAGDSSYKPAGALVHAQGDDSAILSPSQAACAPVVQADPVVMDGSTITQSVAQRAVMKSLEASKLHGNERLAELLFQVACRRQMDAGLALRELQAGGWRSNST